MFQQRLKEIGKKDDKKLLELVKKGGGRDTKNSLSDLQQGILEVLWRYTGSESELDQVTEFVNELISNSKIEESLSEEILPRALWLIGLEISCLENEDEKGLSSEWKRLCALVQRWNEQNLIPSDAIFEKLQLELIAGADLGAMNVMEGKVKKGNTNYLYRQRKYNLLLEESEGYSKLIVLLDSLNVSNINAVKDEMLRLIGYFRLDPNRVFDLVLSTYENSLENGIFINLIEMFKKSNLKQMLGFKFQMYHPREGVVPSVTPISLFKLTSGLIDLNHLTIPEILVHLNPTTEALKEMNRERKSKLIAACRTVGVVRLNVAQTEEAIQQKNKEEAEKTEYTDRISREDLSNQKFGLVAGMIASGKWESAKRLAEYLGLEMCMDHALVKEHLVIQIEYSLNELYSEKFASLILKPVQLEEGTFEVCQDLDMFLNYLGPVLNVFGYRLGAYPALFCKVARLLSICENIHENRRVFDMCRNCILPALSAVDTPNPPLSFAIWDTIGKLPFAMRYDLYETWKTEKYSTVLPLRFVHANVLHESKQILKRIANSKDAMRLMSRRFAKISCNNPIVALGALLDNIQSYDNLIPIVVDSIRLLTPLAFDVLSYLLIVYLGKDEKSKIKEDGQSHSHWLQSLCKFAGFFYLKYSNVEFQGLVHFVFRQLKMNRSLDLLVLEEIIGRMSGITIVEDFSENTLFSLAGGKTLRYVARSALDSNSTPASNQKAASETLANVLNKGQLILPLCISIAQQLNSLLFDKTDKNLKLMGHKYDKCVSVLMQFCEFVSLQVSVQEMASVHLKINLQDLVEKYNLEPEVAFHMARSVITAANNAELDDESVKNWSSTSEQIVGLSKHVIEMRGSSKVLSPELFALFWSLSLYDLVLPRKRYDDELERLNKSVAALADNQSLTEKQKKKESTQMKGTIKSLQEELNSQTGNRNKVLSMIDKSKTSWFATEGESLDAIREFMLLCVLPRVLFSAEDALFAARFCRMMHDQSVPGFVTIFAFDVAIRFMVANLFCVTEREASNLGVFLKEMLEILNMWTKDSKSYSKHVSCKSGAVSDFNDLSSPIMTFTEFKEYTKKWYQVISEAFANAFASKSYMQCRPALVITSKIIDLFPHAKSTAILLKKKAALLGETDLRQDIKTMAKRYEAMLDKALRSGTLENDCPDEEDSQPKRKRPREINFDDEEEPSAQNTSNNKGKRQREPSMDTANTKDGKSGETSTAGSTTSKGHNKSGGDSEPSSKRHKVSGKDEDTPRDKVSGNESNPPKDTKDKGSSNTGKQNTNDSKSGTSNTAKSSGSNQNNKSSTGNQQQSNKGTTPAKSNTKDNHTAKNAGGRSSQNASNTGSSGDQGASKSKENSNTKGSNPSDNTSKPKDHGDDNRGGQNRGRQDAQKQGGGGDSRSKSDNTKDNRNNQSRNDNSRKDDGKSNRDDESRVRNDDNRGRNDDNRGRNDDNRGRNDDNRGRNDDNRGRNDDNRGRNDDNRGRNDDSRGGGSRNDNRQGDHGRNNDNNNNRRRRRY